MAFILRRIGVILVAFVCIMNIYGLLPSAHASLISTQQEIDIGRNVAKQLENQFGLVDDPELQARVMRIGMSLVAVSDRKDLPYTFKVLNSKEINAMAAPGGFVYVFKGLIDLMPSDDELAGVIGHEIGHVVKRHTVHQIEKNLGMSILFGVAFGTRGAMLQSLAMDAIMAGYSRTDEREADYLGYIHSYKAGYNPYSMTMGLIKLSSIDQKYHYDMFSDHPEGKARIASVQKYLDDAKVHPKVQLASNGKAAVVIDGSWQLPTIDTEFDGYTPICRAYFAAGSLYRVSQLPDYNPDNFILDYDGSNVIIYYDDRQIITITPQDAIAHDMSVMDFAGTYIDKLKEWKR